MSLSDGDVAALAGQAVDMLAPGIDIEIEPAAGDDPYRRGRRSWSIWPRIDGRRSFGISLNNAMSPVEALAHLIDRLGQYAAEQKDAWGKPFPACPGHAHPAQVSESTPEAVVLRCPETREIVAQIRPAVLD